MIARVWTELIEITAFARRYRDSAIVISLSTLFLMLARYHALASAWQTYMLYYFFLPMLSIVVVLRRNPLDFGLRAGTFRIWSVHLLVALPIIFGIVYLLATGADVQRYYHSKYFNPAAYMFDAGIRLFAWEFLFRGFMLFGLKDKLKEAAILVQMIPFALLHLGKPETETISCIFSGIYFGYICYRGGAFWPAFILHIFINYSIKFLAIYHF